MADYNSNFTPEELQSEIWKTIPSFRAYDASTLGRIRRAIPGPRTKAGNLLKPSLGRTGYMKVVLYHKAQGKRYANIHALVAEAFLGPRKTRTCIDHKDGTKTNNRLSNLDYVSYVENRSRAIALGLTIDRKGSELQWAKLTEKDIPDIRAASTSGESYTSIAKRYGVDRGAISQIDHGRTWQHVPSPTPTREGFKPVGTLTAQDIPVIRHALKEGETCASIARRYEVDRTTINLIKLGKTWKHV